MMETIDTKTEDKVEATSPAEISFPEAFLDKLRDEDEAGGPDEKTEDNEDKTKTTSKAQEEDKSKTTTVDETGKETTGEEKTAEELEAEKEAAKVKSDVKLDEATQSLLSEFKTEEGKALVVADKDGKVHEIGELVQDIINSSNWKAEQTAKSQALGDERASFEKTASELSIEPIIKELSIPVPEGVEPGSDKDNTLMSALDEWFEGSDKNPFRKISAIQQFTEKQLADGKAKAEESVRTAFVELAKVDEKYSNPTEQAALLNYANQHYVSLEQAHKLQQLDSLTSEVDSLKKELKTRTEQYTELKEKGVTAEETTLKDDNPSGPGNSGTTYADKPKSFEEAAERGRKAFLGA